MHLINRAFAIDLLLEQTSNLRVTTSYQKKTLDRFLSNAWDQDRHVTVGEFETNEKTFESFKRSNLVFFEIDDIELKNSDKSNEILEQKLDEHVKIVSRAMKEFAKRIDYKPYFNWPNPLLATYSGNKSFHLLYQFDRHLSKEEYSFCREQFSLFERVTANAPEKYPNSRKLDFQVIFSHPHCPRFPCDIPQDNRKPQVGYIFDRSLHFLRYINTEDFLAVVRTHQKINNIIFKEKKKANSSKNVGISYSNFTKEILEDILDITLVPTTSGDKFLITCINPDHNDSNRSAFICLNGFSYCTVCCKGGKRWISRVLHNSKIVHNKDHQ